MHACKISNTSNYICNTAFSLQPIEASVLRIFGSKYSFDAFILQLINIDKVKIWVMISLCRSCERSSVGHV